MTKKSAIEPRIALKYVLTEKSQLALAYGRHSHTGSLPVYFVRSDLGKWSNQNLDLMKSSHLVLSYSIHPSENLKLSVEPYYQFLNDVPVVPNSYISTINSQDNLFFNQSLISGGTARNLGLDHHMGEIDSTTAHFYFTIKHFRSR